eukprot:4526244-Pyramimonas_sp.AAC.1
MVIPWRRKFKRYDARVRVQILYGVEGSSSDIGVLRLLHKEEGKMLSRMCWRQKRNGESFATFMTRMFRRGRLMLHKEGKPSLVQLYLHRQFMWAKDVATECFENMAGSLQDLCISATGGSQLIGKSMEEEMMEMEVEESNRRKRKSALIREVKRAREGESQNTSRLQVGAQEKQVRFPGRKLRFREGEHVDRGAQSRLLMLHAGFEWTNRRDDFIATLDTQSAREVTRARG